MQDLSNLPFGSDYDPPERIICAANKYGDTVLCGVRHGCDNMYSAVDVFGIAEFRRKVGVKHEQGFITSKHRFVDRYEAWKIAVDQNQIVRRVGGDTINGGKLFSENLY